MKLPYTHEWPSPDPPWEPLYPSNEQIREAVPGDLGLCESHFRGDDTQPCEQCGEYFSQHGPLLQCPTFVLHPGEKPA